MADSIVFVAPEEPPTASGTAPDTAPQPARVEGRDGPVQDIPPVPTRVFPLRRVLAGLWIALLSVGLFVGGFCVGRVTAPTAPPEALPPPLLTSPLPPLAADAFASKPAAVPGRHHHRAHRSHTTE